jgi:hypothetical protein
LKLFTNTAVGGFMKIYLVLIIIFIVIFSVWYFIPISLNNIFNNYVDLSNIETVDVIIFKTVFSNEELTFSDKSKINDVIKILEDIHVRRLILPISNYTFKPDLYKTFYISLSFDSYIINIDIMDDKHIIVKDRIYKIVGDVNLKKLYDNIYDR